MYELLSPRAIQMFSRLGFRSDPAWTVAPETLRGMLERHGLPVYDVALEAEALVGGYGLPDGAWRLGVYAGLARFDGSVRWTRKGLPHAEGRPLLPVSAPAPARGWTTCIDEQGALYLAMEEVPTAPAYDRLAQFLEILALELDAAAEGDAKRHFVASEVRMPGLAQRLGLDAAEAASGAFIRTWSGEGAHLFERDTPGYHPGTRLATRSAPLAADAFLALSAAGAEVRWSGPAPTRAPAGALLATSRSRLGHGNVREVSVWGPPTAPCIAARRVGEPWPWEQDRRGSPAVASASQSPAPKRGGKGKRR
ncbi:hypothetical protein WME98_35745 [Sorangium sp. So ce296]|uniref:hypothetical protein n=1 Tax=Sorangium sp. So ce296 TaxID=3133296 RepID=UPI003F609B2D